jgi:hypothetical protein
MPRILAPNHSFHRRSSYGSRTSLTSEPPSRRSSLTGGHHNPVYQSACSLRRSEGASGGTKSHSKHFQEQSKQNAEWEQGPSPSPSPTSLFSIQTKSTATTSQSSSISTLPSTNTSSTGLAAALSLMMQQRGSGGAATNNGRQVHPKAQSVPCSPNPPTDLASSFDLNCKIKEEPDCWGQFVDVQSADEAMDRRSRVMRRYPGAPLSFPRY